MKKPVKMSVVAGFCLFGVAALFSISLLLVLADVAGANPAAHTALYRLGKMFTSVYGLCSVLIPTFLIVAAIQCFSYTWTVRRGVLLAGSFLPFFTLDALEHAVRMLMANDSGAVLGIKMCAAFLTGALILAAEYLILLLISDFVESALMKEKIEKGDSANYDGIDIIGSDDELTEENLFDDDDTESNAAAENAQAESAASENAAGEADSEAGSTVLPSGKPSETLADGSANPFANFFGSPLPEPKAPAAEPEHPAEPHSEPAAEPTIEQAIAAEKAGEPITPAVPAASVVTTTPVAEAAPKTAPETAATPKTSSAAAGTSPASAGASFEPYQPVAVSQPAVHEAPYYNENVSPRVAAEEDEPSEMLDLNSFDPEKDSYDGFVSPEEQVGDIEPVDDEIAAFENENADAFDDDFYDIDLNEDDEESDLDTEIDDYEQRLAREELEREEPTSSMTARQASEEIAAAEQKSTSLDSIFAEMDDDAAREVQQNEPVLTNDTGVADEPALTDEIEDAGEDFAEPAVADEPEIEEPVIDEEAEIDFAEDDLFDEIDETIVDDSEQFEEPEITDDIPVVDPLEPPVVDANGIPYETAVSPAAATTAVAPAHSSLSVTVTAAAPATPAVEERPRRKSYATYNIPTEGILESYPTDDYQIVDDATKAAGEELKATLGDFKIEAEVTGIRKGPVVTMFEILPAPGVKLSKIVALQDNIALRLAASSVRIVAPIPGKHAVGIEVPNKERAIVGFKEIIEQDLPQFKKMAIPVVLGKDISGEAQMIDLAKTPHLLIAGSTGAGKSVCVNTMILSILYKRSPDQVKLIMIDPKVVELKLYNDIPHLLTPVITEPKKAFQSLQYCLCEMERRYALLDGMGVRDIVSYNNRIVERHIATEKLPYIVVIIDEFADLMATTGKELESTLARLAAMSRAVGIHLVLATQRPSIDVITGLIKANIPSRIAFMVASKMDSRIIIDQVGAEKLLGKGDMLYASATDPFPVRIQGTLVNDNEVERVVNCVKSYGEPEYIDDEIFVDDEDEGANPGLFSEGDDPLYDEALEIVMQAGKASASYIQRRLKIGYNRAARLVEEMEEHGIVGPANGSKPREVIHMV